MTSSRYRDNRPAITPPLERNSTCSTSISGSRTSRSARRSSASHRDADRASSRATRSLRRRLGESLVRLGRRVGGDAMTTPAWQG